MITRSYLMDRENAAVGAASPAVGSENSAVGPLSGRVDLTFVLVVLAVCHFCVTVGAVGRPHWASSLPNRPVGIGADRRREGQCGIGTHGAQAFLRRKRAGQGEMGHHES